MTSPSASKSAPAETPGGPRDLDVPLEQRAERRVRGSPASAWSDATARAPMAGNPVSPRSFRARAGSGRPSGSRRSACRASSARCRKTARAPRARRTPPSSSRIDLLPPPPLPAPREDSSRGASSAATSLAQRASPLHDLVPGRSRLDPVAAADALLAEEAEHDPEPVRRGCGSSGTCDRAAEALPQETVAEGRPERPDVRRRQVDLAHGRSRDLDDREPPRDGVGAAEIRSLVDEEQRMRAEGREILQVREHVGAAPAQRRGAPRWALTC